LTPSKGSPRGVAGNSEGGGGSGDVDNNNNNNNDDVPQQPTTPFTAQITQLLAESGVFNTPKLSQDALAAFFNSPRSKDLLNLGNGDGFDLSDGAIQLAQGMSWTPGADLFGGVCSPLMAGLGMGGGGTCEDGSDVFTSDFDFPLGPGELDGLGHLREMISGGGHGGGSRGGDDEGDEGDEVSGGGERPMRVVSASASSGAAGGGFSSSPPASAVLLLEGGSQGGRVTGGGGGGGKGEVVHHGGGGSRVAHHDGGRSEVMMHHGGGGFELYADPDDLRS